MKYDFEQNLMVSKQLLEMQKGGFNVNTYKIFITILNKKVKEALWYSESYDSDGNFDRNNICFYRVIEDEVKINMDDLKKVFGGNKSYKEMLEKIIYNMPKTIRYNTHYNKDMKYCKEKREIEIPLFDFIEYYHKTKEIGFTIHRKIAEYLSIQELPFFGTLNLRELFKLQSMSQLRMYDYICQNNYLDIIGNKKVKEEMRKIKIEDFKEYFRIPASYKLGNIDQKFIKPVVEAINKHTEYNIRVVKLNQSYDKRIVTHYRIDTELKK